MGRRIVSGSAQNCATVCAGGHAVPKIGKLVASGPELLFNHLVVPSMYDPASWPTLHRSLAHCATRCVSVCDVVSKARN